MGLRRCGWHPLCRLKVGQRVRMVHEHIVFDLTVGQSRDAQRKRVASDAEPFEAKVIGMASALQAAGQCAKSRTVFAPSTQGSVQQCVRCAGRLFAQGWHALCRSGCARRCMNVSKTWYRHHIGP